MLGMTPLVSISDRRLGLMTNSWIPRDSASVVLAISTSRRVRPVCSRSSRNFLPADCTCSPLLFSRPHLRGRLRFRIQVLQTFASTTLHFALDPHLGARCVNPGVDQFWARS